LSDIRTEAIGKVKRYVDESNNLDAMGECPTESEGETLLAE
jgi:hypothetical protein